MYFAKYLLSIEEFIPRVNEIEKALLERAFSCVDETRREKAERMRPGRARAACLGAGLLLQLAVGEAATVSSTVVGMFGIQKYTVSQLLSCVENMPRIPFSYIYGENGKPYFKNFPFYFNLSHSGDYVLCGLSDVEIGADIQHHCGKNVGKLARRFFSEREAAALEQAGEEREKLFYRLWARKEAYGKLTGKGIAGVLDVDLLPGDGAAFEMKSGTAFNSRQKGIPQEIALPEGRRLLWNEYEGIEDYSIAFCRYG